MLTSTIRLLAACLVMSMAIAAPARAQWAVIDVPAIVQLVQQVQTLQKQVSIAGSQLQSAQQALQAMTGDRGMEGLLGGTTRNYLPSNWTQVTGALPAQGLPQASQYSGLSADVQSAVTANAVLSPQRVAMLSRATQQQVQAERQWNAMQQALAQQALANASSRFDAIQSLVSSISTATDQKAILDLQARISAELGMLQNEQTKNQLLYQATQAQQSTLRQQARERVAEEHGDFATRFQPVP